MPGFDVAAYLWPSYHYEPRLAHFWPEGDGEWYTVRRGTPRFPGHDMPRVPLLGFQDEADPAVMAQHVALAAEHAVNVFIVDWYWYEEQPCLERQLNDGLLPALEGTDNRFFLMWANHDATTLWDMHTDANEVLWTGRVTRAQLEPMFDRLLDRYLAHDRYYRIDGRPVFSIFESPTLVAGLGGVDATRDALDWMRGRAVRAGLPGLHLQAIARFWDAASEAEARALGFDSATSYQFCMDAGGEGDYVPWAQRAMAKWEAFEDVFGTYFPHASVGWDDTHRHPGTRTAVTGSHPASFEAVLWRCRAYLEARPQLPKLVTINSWNEWTEGSYLLPDLRWGYEYLRAVRKVFG